MYHVHIQLSSNVSLVRYFKFFLETTTEEVKFDYNEGLATKLLGKVLKTQDHY